MKPYLQSILDRALPCSCQLCGQPSFRSVALCELCQDSLVLNAIPCCRCSTPLIAASEVPCAHCQQQAPAFSHSTAPFLYTAPLDGFITRLKFSADHCQLPLLAELMSESVQTALCHHGRPDALIPVPLHWRKQWQRGFNQAALLANQLARHKRIRPWNLEVQARWCRRRRATRAQLGLDRTQRHSNMRQAFDCSANLADLYVVIIDDVMTTGATATALTNELLRHGARRVDVWCCARTPVPTG